jgi:hypothetical protein
MAQIPVNITQTHRDLYYSVGTDQTKNVKERIAEVHGLSSEPMKAAYELDCYISDPETRKSPWYWNFNKKVKSAMSGLYPHANDAVRTAMTREFIEDLLNGGYIRALQSLAVESGAEHARLSQDYANRYDVSIGAALLFGPRGALLWNFSISWLPRKLMVCIAPGHHLILPALNKQGICGTTPTEPGTGQFQQMNMARKCP